MTPSEIEPSTFWLVAQCLSLLRHCVPHLCRVFTIIYLKPTVFLGCRVYCWNYFVAHIIPHSECFVLLNQYIPKYVCSAQCDCDLQFLDFVLSGCITQIFSKRFWDGSIRSYFYTFLKLYKRCIYIARSLYFRITWSFNTTVLVTTRLHSQL
jgi:hypothetical protein